MKPEASDGPAVVLEIDAGRASVETLMGAIDAAVASELDELSVRVTLAEADARQPAVAQLCGSDPRIDIATPDAPAPQAEVALTMPAHGRPHPRTVPQVVERVRADRLAALEVRLPGRLGLGGKLRASATGTGTKRVRAAEVGLRAVRTGGDPGPPPPADLATERAEHLRHRARSSTMRARLDRNAHRLSRERLQVRHERTRMYLAEQRLGRSGPAEWVRWRSRAVGRRAAALPGAARSAVQSTRALGRRARRFALDRWRSRGAERR